MNMSVAMLLLVRMLMALAALVAISWLIVRFGTWRLYFAALAVIGSVASVSIWAYSKHVVPPLGGCSMPSRVGELGLDLRLPEAGGPRIRFLRRTSFAPQGLSVSDHSATGGPIRVAVVAHVGRETIQFFDFVSEPRARLSWRGCIFYPEHTTGNDIALFEDGSLVGYQLPTGGRWRDWRSLQTVRQPWAGYRGRPFMVIRRRLDACR